ncbi:MAG TPA: hypothetical protein VKT82_12220 [Ktedonobacterales bacterium]|nr:hypothetical protein [Ktedonobacterales bacterium]
MLGTVAGEAAWEPERVATAARGRARTQGAPRADERRRDVDPACSPTQCLLSAQAGAGLREKEESGDELWRV